ncbi:MAG: response regulator, partial [Spirochaetales bacterium]|nr:response regulator [Spirochaetales bacterium]
MDDELKTKEELIIEINSLRKYIKDLKENRAEHYLQDISDSKKAEHAISMFFEQSLVMLCITDLETKKFVRVNNELMRITGHTEIKLLTQPIIDFIHPGDREPIKKMLTLLKKGNPVSGFRTRFLTDQNTYRTFEWNATTYDELHLAYIMAIDVTEREKEDAELQNMQRLESLGLVAGGIAHDFNNLLQGLFLYISLAKDTPGIDAEVADYLNSALSCFNRAKDLTQQLLTFSKGGSPIKKLLDVETLIRESIRLALSGSNIKCIIDMPEVVHPVKADSGQLHQAISNILINSRHAMPEGGNIIITCSNKVIRKRQIQNLAEGPYISISIKDHGEGIRKELLSKVFDPFFTTKQIGSGLGLSTAYSIIKKHEGHISIDSEIGAGTIVTILLPASKEKIEEQILGPVNSPSAKIRILLMDDEQIILDSTGRLLMQLDYIVDLAHTGEQAIQLYVEAMKLGRKYDIVILDLTIPGGMGGERVLKNLLKIDPDIKALVSSGYSDSEICANPQKYGFIDKITKP